MNRIFILVLMLCCVFMAGCEQNISTDVTSNIISEEINPSQTDDITETTSQPTVSLMTDWNVWYEDTSNRFILAFSLVDENRNEIYVPVEVDVNICDSSNQMLYNGHHDLTETSYQTWQYNDGTKRYQATIYINVQEINIGSSENGTIAFTVYNSEKFVFDEIKLDINNLPYHNYPQNITLSYTTNSIFIGEQTILCATLTPTDTEYKEIIWSSSDESIATVNDGVVTGIKPGIVKISATTTNGINASCQISVSEKNVTNISLTPLYKNLYVGETVVLNAQIHPNDATNKTISWSSSDESIAKVDDNGNVTTFKAGTVIIYASASNGVKKSCNITVSEKIITYLNINLFSTELYVGESVKLDYLYIPDDAQNTILTWHSSDSSIASVDSFGNVIGIKDGTVTITASTTTGVKDTCVIKVKTNWAAGCSLSLPHYPQTLSYFSVSSITGQPNVYSRTEITNISYKFEESSTNGKVKLTIFFSGEKTYGAQSNYCKFGWKLFDNSGYVVESGNFLLGGLSTGDKFKDKTITIWSINPGDYKLEIYSYS